MFSIIIKIAEVVRIFAEKLTYNNSFQLSFMFSRTVLTRWQFCLSVLPSAVVVLQLEIKGYHFLVNFADFNLKARITQLAFTE